MHIFVIFVPGSKILVSVTEIEFSVIKITCGTDDVGIVVDQLDLSTVAIDFYDVSYVYILSVVILSALFDRSVEFSALHIVAHTVIFDFGTSDRNVDFVLGVEHIQLTADDVEKSVRAGSSPLDFDGVEDPVVVAIEIFEVRDTVAVGIFGLEVEVIEPDGLCFGIIIATDSITVGIGIAEFRYVSSVDIYFKSGFRILRIVLLAVVFGFIGTVSIVLNI